MEYEQGHYGLEKDDRAMTATSSWQYSYSQIFS